MRSMSTAATVEHHPSRPASIKAGLALAVASGLFNIATGAAAMSHSSSNTAGNLSMMVLGVVAAVWATVAYKRGTTGWILAAALPVLLSLAATLVLRLQLIT